MIFFRFLLLATSVLLITSCNEATSSSTKISRLKIEAYLDTVQRKFLGFENNSAIKDELNEYLKKDFENAIQTGVLTDLPFKLDKAEKCGSKYVLTLEHSLTSKLYDRDLLGQLELDLYAITDDTTAKSLHEGQFYLVDVAFKEYITYQNNKRYCAAVLMSPFMGYFSNELQFGAIGVELRTITKVIK